MKHLHISCILALSLIACNGNKHNETESQITPAQALIERLQALQDSGLIAFGHHDDVSYGYNWEYMPDSSDVKNVCGDYPAIINWDLGLIETGADKQLDGVPFDFMKREIAKHDARGGINSISWHLHNPATGGNAWDTSGGNVVAQCLTDSALNDTITAWIGQVADFIGDLRDADGNRIPVIFRPWHEQTGDWFWWCAPYRTPDEFIALWQLTRKVFDDKGLDNVVWAYSPDKSNCTTMEQYMADYPGDDFVDIFGADVYHFNGEDGVPLFNEWITNMLTFATTMAKEKGKIAALTETGSEALRMPNWYTQVLYPAIKDYPIAYITVWRNAYRDSKPEHFYAPYPGHQSATDFVEFYNLPQTAFCADLKSF